MKALRDNESPSSQLLIPQRKDFLRGYHTYPLAGLRLQPHLLALRKTISLLGSKRMLETSLNSMIPGSLPLGIALSKLSDKQKEVLEAMDIGALPTLPNHADEQ